MQQALKLSEPAKMTVKIWYILLVIVVTSCGGSRNLVYFSNLSDSENYKSTIENRVEPIIQADDLLGITMNSLNPESNLLFNSGTLQTVGSTGIVNSEKANEGYLVDKSGSINYPVVGNIKIGGMTKLEAAQKLTERVSQYVKNPVINIRYLNFKITVVGEVNRPATFTIPTEKINIIEALGLAGDMTAYGKRNNVLIIRERNGVRTTVRVNLTNKESLNSPYYYLQQNDIIYVEPEKIKSLQVSSGNYYLPIVATIASILSVAFFAFR